MKTRKLISLTTLLSFLLIVLTGVVLYIVPPGRVAYWSDWHWLGLSKTEWGNLHVTSSLLFCIVGIWHIYFNWKPIVQYLKGRRPKASLPSAEFLLSFALTAVLCVGTYLEWPPFSWVLALEEHIKDAGSEKYGEPPYGHAELSSLKTLTQRMRLDLPAALKTLEANDIAIDGADDTIQQIADRNKMLPNRIFEIILAGQRKSTADGATSVPLAPPSGVGRLTLRRIADKYNIEGSVIRSALEAEGISVDADATIRSIAEASGRRPMEVYELIRNAAADGERD